MGDGGCGGGDDDGSGRGFVGEGRGSMQTIKQNKQAGGVSGDVEKIVFGGLVTLANA